MAASLRGPGETRALIVEHLQQIGHPQTWPECAAAAGITAGYRTLQRMLLSAGQIQEAGVNEAGVQLYEVDAAGSEATGH